jgi:hypothetical protein
MVKQNTWALSISYRNGNRFRSELYRQIDANREVIPLETSKISSEKIRDWASQHLALARVCIFDGEYEYSYTPGEDFQKPQAEMRVEQHAPEWIYVLISQAIHDQWSYINNVGPMNLLRNEPGIPSGCVLLHYEGSDLRRDWYIDPGRSSICVKKVEFRKNKKDGLWTADNNAGVELTDFTHLPSGPWYASRQRQGREISECTIKPLSDVEMEQLTGNENTTAFFDGEKLLKTALDNGTKIIFRAR